MDGGGAIRKAQFKTTSRDYPAPNSNATAERFPERLHAWAVSRGHWFAEDALRRGLNAEVAFADALARNKLLVPLREPFERGFRDRLAEREGRP